MKWHQHILLWYRPLCAFLSNKIKDYLTAGIHRSDTCTSPCFQIEAQNIYLQDHKVLECRQARYREAQMQQNTLKNITFLWLVASCLYQKPDSLIMNHRAPSQFSNQCFYTKVHVGSNEIMARSLFSGSVGSTELTVLLFPRI